MRRSNPDPWRKEIDQLSFLGRRVFSIGAAGKQIEFVAIGWAPAPPESPRPDGMPVCAKRRSPELGPRRELTVVLYW